MIIRKIGKNEIVSKKKLTNRIILIAIIALLGQGIRTLVHKSQTEVTTGRVITQALQSKISTQGYMVADNNFPHYTHSIVDDNKDTIGLKSASINLNNYINQQVELVGVLESVLKTTPILEVQSIKLANQGLVVYNNKYLFTKDFLYLDFSNQPQLTATRSGNIVEIMYEGKVVAQIERFLCAKIFKNQNCETLVNEYTTKQKDNFVSYRGDTYYKHMDKVWITFDGKLFGYVFKQVDDETMLNLSSMIRLVNKDFLLQSKMDQIQTTCSDGAEHIEKIDSAKIQYGDPQNITLILRGESNQKNTVDCTMTFDTWNQWKTKKIGFSYPG
jgi:hypothetical protein